jgi:hypothetical protein
VWATLAFAALVWWLRSDRPRVAILAMGLVSVHAVINMRLDGQGFANHDFLQAVLGIFGMLAAGRQLAGEPARNAWRPVAVLGLAVWGIAGAKKLLHMAYLDGEFIASLSGVERNTVFSSISKTLVGGDVPAGCCFTGEMDVSTPAALLVVGLGVGMAMAELSPVVVSRFAPRATVGWLMLGLSIVATSVANEMHFGLVLVAFAGLWGEGRTFRRVAVLASLGLAVGYLVGAIW